MAISLYLDTARLGRMCPEAQAADRDFARLASEEGCSLYFEQFLRWGHTALPPILGRHYPGLAFWAGVSAFKNDLKTVLCLPRERQVFVANRSAQLVRLAARLLCQQCENILVSDMEWPAYMRALAAECQQRGRILTTVPMREAVLRDKIGMDEAIDHLVNAYRGHGCDGLFLSAVTYQGVQLPIRQVVQALRPCERPRFVVVDGAQALNHVPLRLAEEYCDLFLAGCHKWLRAYQPLGLTLCCRAASERLVADACNDMLAAGSIDDPLLTFVRQIESNAAESFSETVNLAPLFTAAAAIRRMLLSPQPKRQELAVQLENADHVAQQAAGAGWHPFRPTVPMQSGIVLLEPKSRASGHVSTEAVRQRFLTAGIAVTAYEDGTIRASLPEEALAPGDVNLLRTAFSYCA